MYLATVGVDWGLGETVATGRTDQSQNCTNSSQLPPFDMGVVRPSAIVARRCLFDCHLPLAMIHQGMDPPLA
jgi:hypothetical protein